MDLDFWNQICHTVINARTDVVGAGIEKPRWAAFAPKNETKEIKMKTTEQLEEERDKRISEIDELGTGPCHLWPPVIWLEEAIVAIKVYYDAAIPVILSSLDPIKKCGPEAHRMNVALDKLKNPRDYRKEWVALKATTSHELWKAAGRWTDLRAQLSPQGG